MTAPWPATVASGCCSATDRARPGREPDGGGAAASFGPEVDIEGQITRVPVEQVGAVDVERRSELSGHLSREELWGVDDALLTVLGLR